MMTSTYNTELTGYSSLKKNSMDPRISVIIPIYGVEQYLCECVDSVLAQTYSHLEIILIDDGSPDGCGEICDQYAQKDDRVISLHKANGGLSDARNYGLRHAHGEWISFIDSDDFISPVFIETLYEAAIAYRCPVAAVPGGKSFLDGDVCKLEEKKCSAATALLEAREVLEKMLYQRVATGAPWRLYRREVLGNDPFPVGLYYEDLASTYKFIHRAGEVALVECKSLYAYRLRSNSIIREEFTPVKAISAYAIAEQLYQDIAGWYPDLLCAAASRAFSVCRMVYAQAPQNEQEYRSMLWEVICKHKHVVLHDFQARKRERIAAAAAFLGEAFFSSFCSACQKIGLMQ